MHAVFILKIKKIKFKRWNESVCTRDESDFVREDLGTNSYISTSFMVWIDQVTVFTNNGLNGAF
jgi:hypothetical protein